MEVIQAQVEWDRTGAQNEQVAHQYEGGADEEERLLEPGSMAGFTPLTIQFRIWCRGLH